MSIDKTKPYISVNKLAEYMTAKPVRRRQIITALKKDSDFIKTYYSAIKNTLIPYFKSQYDDSILEAKIKEIEAKSALSDWEKSDNKNSIIALECLLDSNLPVFDDYEIISDEFSLEKVNLSGVTVSIKPKIYFRHKSSGKVGAMKFHIAKTPANQLLIENREYVATLIKYAFLENGLSEKEISNEVCLSLDVFQKDYNYAPRAYKRTIKSLEAACEEIALRW